jgi:hypothetical protein
MRELMLPTAPGAIECRDSHHLDSWRQNFITEQVPPPVPEGRVLKTLKNENDELKAELRRKDKALAEAAALLVLQKKFRALWDNEDK